MGLRLGAPYGGVGGADPMEGQDGLTASRSLSQAGSVLFPVWGLPGARGWAGCEWLLCSHSRLPQSKQRAIEVRMHSEVLTLLSNLADLANAVHWLPPGVLWAGRFPPWLVGLMGTISSLLSIYQAAQASGQPEAASP